jgi:hypothetical protein
MESKERILDFTEKLPTRVLTGDQERNNRIINSTIAFLASYTVVYVSFQFVTALFAKRYNLFYKLFFFKVEYTQNWDYWQIEPVLKTFLAGPIFCLFAGIICFVIQNAVRKKPGIIKFFWLWLGVNYLNFVGTQVILLPIKSGSENLHASNLGVVSTYLFWDDFTKIIFSIIASLLMIFVGFIASKPFIQTSNSTSFVYKNENKVVYLFHIVFLPYIIGSGITLVYFSDGYFILNITIILTLFITVISIFINSLKSRMIMIYRFPETNGIENRFLIFLASALILMKIFFNNGISF